MNVHAPEDLRWCRVWEDGVGTGENLWAVVGVGLYLEGGGKAI